MDINKSLPDREPGFYAIIPANVRYDKDIGLIEKLLFGEIARLSIRRGYCSATNKYFAELYGLTPHYISNSISNLANHGYIQVEVLNKNERRIYMPLYALPPEVNKLDYSVIVEAIKRGLSLINSDNSTVPENAAVVAKSATTESVPKRPRTNEEICPFFEDLWKEYPNKLGKNRVSKKSLNEINKVGYDKMKIALDSFIKYHRQRGTEQRYIQYGSTFFNGGYKDFLDGVPEGSSNYPDLSDEPGGEIL